MEDNMEKINCPACGAEMEKIFMPAQGVHLDVCTNGCGGIYFDNREFKKFDEPHEDISPLLKVLEGKEFKKVDEEQVRDCPVCGNRMIKNFSSAKHEVLVDECYACGGKFLDYGELEKIRAQYNTEEERSMDVVRNLYREVGADMPIFAKRPNKKSSVFQGVVLGFFFSLIFLMVKMNDILANSYNIEFMKNISITTLCVFVTTVIFVVVFNNSSK